MKNLLVRFLIVCMLILGGCTSGRHIKPETFPGVIFPDLCETLIGEEALQRGQEVVVLSETRPIFRMFGLHLLHSGYDLAPEIAALDDRLDEDKRRGFQAERIDASSLGGKCRWSLGGGQYSDYYGTDYLLLELSGIVEDPYAEDRSFGTFARFSYGGRDGAGWYWIALIDRDSGWQVEKVARLDISDG